MGCPCDWLLSLLRSAPFSSLVHSEHLLAAPALHPFPSSLSPQSFVLSHPSSLFLRVLLGPDSVDLFALHPLPRLGARDWGTACRWRQAGQPPSWLLLNLCWLTLPVPVTRSLGLSKGAVEAGPFLPPPCLLLKKGKWNRLRGL